jgi:hypothetical protein
LEWQNYGQWRRQTRARIFCCDAIEPEHAFEIKPLALRQSPKSGKARKDLSKYIPNLFESQALLWLMVRRSACLVRLSCTFHADRACLRRNELKARSLG